MLVPIVLRISREHSRDLSQQLGEFSSPRPDLKTAAQRLVHQVILRCCKRLVGDLVPANWCSRLPMSEPSQEKKRHTETKSSQSDQPGIVWVNSQPGSMSHPNHTDIITTSSGWWFQTFFIFHNIWDNPSHWRTHIFSRWLKPPTSFFWGPQNPLHWPGFLGASPERVNHRRVARHLLWCPRGEVRWDTFPGPCHWFIIPHWIWIRYDQIDQILP